MTNPTPSVPDRRKDNAKTRAEKNRAFRNWLKTRKRLRKERREKQEIVNVRGIVPTTMQIDEIDQQADEFPIVGSPHTEVDLNTMEPVSGFLSPFRCEQTKRDDGWHVLDNIGRSAGVASSRSKQRVLRDELNRDAS